MDLFQAQPKLAIKVTESFDVVAPGPGETNTSVYSSLFKETKHKFKKSKREIRSNVNIGQNWVCRTLSNLFFAGKGTTRLRDQGSTFVNSMFVQTLTWNFKRTYVS